MMTAQWRTLQKSLVARIDPDIVAGTLDTSSSRGRQETVGGEGEASCPERGSLEGEFGAQWPKDLPGSRKGNIWQMDVFLSSNSLLSIRPHRPICDSSQQLFPVVD